MGKISVLRKKLEDIQNQLESALEEVDHSKTYKEIEKQIFASKVKAYRSKNCLTQRELAERLGVGILSVIRWEGKANMPCGLAKRQLIKAGIIKK